MPRFIPITQIEVSARQRKKMEPKEIKELKESILAHGLIQPPVVVKLEKIEDYEAPRGVTVSVLGFRTRLVAGGRRLRAMTELHQERATFHHEATVVPSGCIPVLMLEGKSLSALLNIEYDENVVRVPLDWQDQVSALAEIDATKKAEAEEAGRKHQVTDTARDLQQSLGGEEKASLSAVRKQVTQALRLNDVLADRPDLQKAKSMHEAYAILLREGSERFESELARRRLAKIDPAKRLWDLKNGDLRQVMIDLPDNEVDLILVDPPYGIDANKEKYAASTWHRYDDSEPYARELSVFIIQEGFRVTKNRSNLFMFCSFDNFSILKEAAARYGWQPWYHPIVWQKSKLEGEAPWGRQGLLRTHEYILWATRGQRGISGPIPDVFPFDKVAARSRVHGAEKPLMLLEYIIEKATAPMDLVLDPCAGSGSALLAAVRKKRRVVGIELDTTYFNRAMSRMANYEQGKDDDALETEPEAAEAGTVGEAVN